MHLQQLEKLIKQISQFSMRLIILSIIFCIQFNCNAQENKKFNDLLKKFKLVELPIDISSIDRGKEISKEEFNMFFNIEPTIWKNEENYYYDFVSKTKLGKYIALIIRRCYDPDIHIVRKDELVLCIFDKIGNVKSSIVIDALYYKDDREVYINFKLNKNLELEIKTEDFQYKNKKEIVHLNYYKINSETGKIEKVSK